MALTINSTTYAGEHALPFINAAVKSSRTIEAGGVKLMSNVKYKDVIQNIRTSNVIKDSACDYSDDVTLNTYERVIEPKELQTTLTLCKKDFHNDWLSKYQVASANDNVPSNFETYILSYIGSIIGSELEDKIWTGDDGTDDFDGFITRLTDAPAGNLPNQLPALQDQTFTNTGTDVDTGEFRSTSSGSVISALQDVISSVPSSVYSKGPQQFMLYAGFDVVRALVSAYGAQGNGINDQSAMWWNGGFSGLRINGVDIFVTPGIAGTANRGDIVATYKENLIAGTGMMNDTNEATVLDMQKLDGSRNARIIYRYTMGTQIGSINDVVYYAQGTAKA